MKFKIYLILLLASSSLISCDEFVEVNVPNNRISSEVVFSKDETANSAVIGIYNELFRSAFSGGFQSSITVLGDLSADNLQATFPNASLLEFQENEIFPGNPLNLDLWSSAYKIIYMTNAVIGGLDNSDGVSLELKDKLLGEVRVIRAFTYFYLIHFYNEVPLILTTDYRTSSMEARSRLGEINLQILEDLEIAMELLEPEIENGERLRINKFTAIALLARVSLYQENWEKAEEMSSQLINESSTYKILNDLDAVFLANSQEAIWQISPIGGGTARSNTNEGEYFIMIDQLANVAMTEDLISSFSPDDYRLEHWVGTFTNDSVPYYFPYKYKIKNTVGDYNEYSMVMRLAEQYLIRAEALAHQGKLEASIMDLNVIRARANLQLISPTDVSINKDFLLDLILEERRREFFAEWGHRWLDLKRVGKGSSVLSSKKPLWQDSDVFYPIPEEEIRKNVNLIQNPGY